MIPGFSRSMDMSTPDLPFDADRVPSRKWPTATRHNGRLREENAAPGMIVTTLIPADPEPSRR